MADREADVLIVGAGPAGSALAAVLARAGHDVMLLDRALFPRPKPCGEFVNPGAVAALDRLGLGTAVTALSPAKIGGWTLHDDRGVNAQGRYGGGITGLGLPRTELDAALLGAARTAGARVREQVNVLRAVRDSASDRWELFARGGGGRAESLRCRFLVGADGLRSRLARQLGAVRRGRTPPKLSLTCHVRGRGPQAGNGHLYVGDRVTIGLACTHASGELWNVTVVVDPARWRDAAVGDGRRLVGDLLARLPVEWEGGTEIVAGPWASGTFDWPSTRIAGRRHLFVGDAAGYYDPLTGQGICRALRTVELAAPRIGDVLADPRLGRRAAAAYGLRVRRDRGGGRRVQRLIEATLRRTWSRRLALSRLASGRERLTPLLRVTGDVAAPRTLINPASWLGRSAPEPPRSERTHAYG